MEKARAHPDLSRIAVPEKANATKDMSTIDKDDTTEKSPQDLTPDDADELVYQKVLKRKRNKLENGKAAEEKVKASKLKKDLARRKKILKLKMWGANFADQLGMPELNMLEEVFRFTVASRTSGMVTDQSAASAVDFLSDGIRAYTGLKIDGPTISLKQLAASKDFSDLAKELTLEYADFLYTRPEARALMFLINGIYAVHTLNTDAESKPPPEKRQRTEEPVNPNGPKRDKDGYEITP